MGLAQAGAETLAIEGELAQVQQRAAVLHRERQAVIADIQGLSQAKNAIAAELSSLDAKNKPAAGSTSWWQETDLDEMRTVGSNAYAGGPLSPSAADDGRSYVNDTKLFPHGSASGLNNNLDEQKRNNNVGETTLGDISQADDRVKKFYGIIPKKSNAEAAQQPQQPPQTTEANKTVRMVKRDSKERSGNGPPPPPPPPLPRGNYHNLHDFLQKDPAAANSASGGEPPKRRGQIITSTDDSSRGGSISSSSGDSGTYVKKPNFVIGGESTGGGVKPRPGSALSAHERLFGSSRENSLSPPMSPGKNSMASPVFKSATAKAIAEEVGNVGGGAAGRRRSRQQNGQQKKQRSHTISGGNAVTEALNEHQAKMVDCPKFIDSRSPSKLLFHFRAMLAHATTWTWSRPSTAALPASPTSSSPPSTRRT